MRRLLITRSVEQADPLVRALATQQLETVCVPVTRTEFVGDSAPLPTFETFDWIAFTSANGIRGLAQLLRAAQTSLSSHCRIACLGEATAEVARRVLLREVDFIGSRARGSEFAQSLIAHLGSAAAGTKLLYPCAAVTVTDFHDRCRAAEIDILNWTVYQTLPVDAATLRAELARHNPLHAVVFYAPSAVQAVRQALPQLPGLDVIAIGPTTADALAATGFARIWICPSPALEDVVATVTDACAHH